MKKLLLTAAMACLAGFGAIAQDTIRCFTVEANEMLRERFPEMGTDADFEKWLERETIAFQEKAGSRSVIRLPVVFHVIHNDQPVGGSDNISSALINAQLEQLNNDFRRILGTSGYNDNPVGADTEIEFCMAAIDPNGNPMAEPGIHRINAASLGLNPPGYSISYMDNTVKPTTQWNPDEYINIWVVRINFFFGTILGYAQFPSQTGLPGLNANEGLAATDGVVVRPTTVGSTSLGNSAGGVNGFGRTLTHELGHFFGLRHIWGDGGCSADDFCADTPQSSGASSGCPSSKVTCNTPDMVENYMDYSNDGCMNIFTLCQKSRMQVVMNNSPRRGSLINSPACGEDVVTPPCENPYPQVTGLGAVVSPGSVALSWEPIPGSLGCAIEGGLASGLGAIQSFQINQPEVSGFNVPGSLLQPGTAYRWRVRCGCSLNPVVAGPWSAYSFFSTPSGLIGQSGAESAFEVLGIYPNPTTGLLNVQLQGGSGTATLRIINTIGHPVLERSIALGGDASLHSIDMQGFAKGFYMVQISNATSYLIQKVVLE